MAETQIRFEDGLSYERYMGDWSRRVGTIFIDWLALPSGLKWIDVGCGNGAFTELIVERSAPTEVGGIQKAGQSGAAGWDGCGLCLGRIGRRVRIGANPHRAAGNGA